VSNAIWLLLCLSAIPAVWIVVRLVRFVFRLCAILWTVHKARVDIDASVQEAIATQLKKEGRTDDEIAKILKDCRVR
jgi:hypothetical protein